MKGIMQIPSVCINYFNFGLVKLMAINYIKLIKFFHLDHAMEKNVYIPVHKGIDYFFRTSGFHKKHFLLVDRKKVTQSNVEELLARKNVVVFPLKFRLSRKARIEREIERERKGSERESRQVCRFLDQREKKELIEMIYCLIT